jgi:hypothetical protein
MKKEYRAKLIASNLLWGAAFGAALSWYDWKLVIIMILFDVALTLNMMVEMDKRHNENLDKKD